MHDNEIHFTWLVIAGIRRLSLEYSMETQILDMFEPANTSGHVSDLGVVIAGSELDDTVSV